LVREARRRRVANRCRELEEVIVRCGGESGSKKVRERLCFERGVVESMMEVGFPDA